MTGLDSKDKPSARYRLVAPIGRGGMAEVLLALDGMGAGVEKPVVLKRIWPDLAEDPDFVAMFRDEAGLAMRLDHPNVVRTHELIDETDQLAMVMEYLHGQPLAALIKRAGRATDFTLPVRLRVLVEVLAGLSYAHDLTNAGGAPLGVVHRDVSPENIFVTYDGQVKLMDFGVAQTGVAGHRTRPGTLKGKLSYLAPECIRGGGVDRRTDIFSVGIVLWELLAGRRLWQGKGEAQIIKHLAAGTPMPRLPVSEVRPSQLDAICGRALAVDPNRRYATADEMEADLRAVMASVGDSQPRLLGGVVSRAFAETRIEREALISGALDSRTPSGSWAGDLDAMLPTIDGFFEETVVDEWIPPKTPAPVARRRARVRITVASAVSVVVALGLVAARAQWDDGQASSPPRTVQASAPAAEVARPPEVPRVPVTHVPAIPIDDPPAPIGAFAPAGAPVANLRAHPTSRPITNKLVTTSPVPISAPVANADRRLARRWGSGRRNRQQGNDGFSGHLPDRMDNAGTAAPIFDDRGVDRLRPSSARTIDESDPFR